MGHVIPFLHKQVMECGLKTVVQGIAQCSHPYIKGRQEALYSSKLEQVGLEIPSKETGRLFCHQYQRLQVAEPGINSTQHT